MVWLLGGLKLTEIVGFFALCCLWVRRTDRELREVATYVRTGAPYRQPAERVDGDGVDVSRMGVFYQHRWTTMVQERDRYRQALETVVAVGTSETCTVIAETALGRKR